MKAVAAMAENRVIGRDNSIPWHLPEDFRWFKELTSGGIVLMGRKTFDSLPKLLPNRTHVIFTRNPAQLACDPQFVAKAGGRPIMKEWEGRLASEEDITRELWLAQSPKQWLEALAKFQPSRAVFVIGGAEIYGQFLPHCSDLYLTVVHREAEGDAFFPPFEHLFAPQYEIARATPDFEVRHYRSR